MRTSSSPLKLRFKGQDRSIVDLWAKIQALWAPHPAPRDHLNYIWSYDARMVWRYLNVWEPKHIVFVKRNARQMNWGSLSARQDYYQGRRDTGTKPTCPQHHRSMLSVSASAFDGPYNRYWCSRSIRLKYTLAIVCMVKLNDSVAGLGSRIFGSIIRPSRLILLAPW